MSEARRYDRPARVREWRSGGSDGGRTHLSEHSRTATPAAHDGDLITEPIANDLGTGAVTVGW